MTISVDCHACRGTFKVQDKRAGKQVYCKLCNTVVRVPGAVVPSRTSEPHSIPDSDAALSATHEDEPEEVAAIAPLPRLTSSYDSRPARTGRSNRKRSTGRSWRFSPLTSAGFVIAGLLGLLVIGSRLHPLIGMVAFLLVTAVGGLATIAGFGLMIVGGIGLIVVAFEEDTTCGLLYVFLPGYSLYYLVTRWDDTRYPKLAIVGLLLALAGPFLMFGVTTLLGG